MEIERRHAPVPAELLDYLRANPSAQRQAAEGGVHIHVHHHHAPAAPAPAGPVHQGPPQTTAEKVIPWLWTALLACLVLTLCALVFAMVAIVFTVVLVALVLLGLVVAYIINSQGSTAMARATADAMRDKGKHKRR